MFEETAKPLGIHTGQGSGVRGYALMSGQNDGRAGMGPHWISERWALAQERIRLTLILYSPTPISGSWSILEP